MSEGKERVIFVPIRSNSPCLCSLLKKVRIDMKALYMLAESIRREREKNGTFT
jgi:hypothetical protein